ncbi:MAG: diguanylate cyclase [Candidatus Omnitrophica bacterium]|nr:diguanylate cyclase [Candidatus Omnitrophota bacterium]
MEKYVLKEADLQFLRSQTAEDDYQKLYRFNQTLVNTIPYGVGVVDGEGNILFLSKQLEDHLGKPPIGSKCWDLYRDDKTQCLYCPLRKNIKVGETRTIESSGVFGGKIFQITHTGMIFDGKKAVLEVYHDITEQKKNEEKIRILAENLKTEKQKLEKVLSIDLRMRSIRKLNDLVDFVVEKSTEILEADRCSLMLLDAGSNELAIRGAKGLDDEIITGSRVKLGSSISGMVAEESCPILVKDIESNVRFARQNRPSYRTKSFISAPIKAHNKVIGVVNIADKKSPPGGPFSETDLSILCTIVHLASVAIENADFIRQLTHLSMTDSMTGMHNHRFFVRTLDQEVSRSKRYTTSLCLLMMDIDNFKSYNDTFGHLEGDQLLKTVGRILKASLRVTDVACRYAGDEFVIILPETDVSEAMIVAERIKKAVETSLSNQKTTMSIGLAKYAVPHMSKYDFILKADTALYEAKKRGKNRIHCFE